MTLRTDARWSNWAAGRVANGLMAVGTGSAILIILHCSMFPKLLKLLKWGHENASPGTRANPLLASIGA